MKKQQHNEIIKRMNQTTIVVQTLLQEIKNAEENQAHSNSFQARKVGHKEVSKRIRSHMD